MDTQQTNDLTFTKVNDLDLKLNEVLDLVTDINPEGSTTLKDLTAQINTKANNINTKVNTVKDNSETLLTNTTSLKTDVENITTNVDNLSTTTSTIKQTAENNSTKLNTILENLENQTGIDTTELENKILETNNNIETLNTNVNDIADDITTINSNTATIRSNVNSMSLDVDNINLNTASTKEDHKYIKGKLNEILKRIGTAEEEFTDDPYKLNLDYTGKLAENPNPSNYACFEFNKDINFGRFINSTFAYTTGSSFSFKASITYTSEKSFSLYCKQTNFYKYPTVSAGTNTYVFEGSDIAVTNGEIVITFFAGMENILIHNFKLELFAENVEILNKPRKYFVHNSPEKICISKVKDDNGYYLELSKENLNPALLKQEYTLGQNDVSNYQLTYSFYTYLNQTKDIVKVETFTELNNYCYTRYDNNYALRKFSSVPGICTDIGYFSGNAVTQNYIYVSDNINVQFATTRVSPNTAIILTKHTSLISNKICNTCNVMCTNIFDNTDKQATVFTDFAGNNYLFVKSTGLLYEIGFGKNATAYYDKSNPLQVNVYLNDNGYCVKHKILLSEDKTTATPITSKIIGSYDSFFETDSNVYFVEKDGNLYMFKTTEE